MLLLRTLNNNFLWKTQVSKIFCVLLISFFLLLVDWSSLFFLNILLLFVSLLAYSYVSVFGLVTVNFLSTFYFMLKSWSLFYANLFDYTGSQYWHVGSYAMITDTSYVNLAVTLDTYNLAYITLTLSIGCWAILYAYNYMREEPRVFSFIWLLLAFLYSMVLLLSGNSFATILLGWELIGSFSFLLINFWTTRVSTFKAALKTFFFNKLSDLALLIVLILLLFFLSGDFSKDLNLVIIAHNVKIIIFGVSFNYTNIVLFLLSVCCFCKSAQFGFHVWLPDSMEAPVPASALIHSATLVSAGIYLFGRVPAHLISAYISEYIALISSFTAFYGGIVAAYQTDLKRILAYSTISHCGFLFYILTLDNSYSLILYLHLHGWFKSISFMCSGNIIGASNNYQDYRRMGGANSSLRLEQLILSLSILNLGSLPFLLGFFNKHYLLCLFSTTFLAAAPSVFILSASITGVFYSIKLLYGVFYGCDKRSISLKLSNAVLFNNKPAFNNSTGTQLLNLISLVGLVFITGASVFLGLSYPTQLNQINFFTNSFGAVTGLVYFNLYILLFFSVFYYRTSMATLVFITLFFIKFLYTCI